MEVENMDRDIDSFLIADHKRFSEMLCREKDSSEKRIDTFVKTLSVVITALVALTTASQDVEIIDVNLLLPITFAAFLGLGLFGTLTTLAVARSQVMADRWRVRLDMIAEIFHGKDFSNYEPFNMVEVGKRVSSTFVRRRIGTTLSTTIALSSGLAGAAGCFFCIWIQAEPILILLGIIASAVLVWIIDYKVVLQIVNTKTR
jgi:hypothetical protein